MADDCNDIYIDVGSNRGVQVRKLFEPENYPEAPVLPTFDSYFGPPSYRLSNPHLCAFGFEPNPPLEQTLLRLENYYATVRGFRAHFFTRTAVGTAYGEQPFFFYEDRDANVASSLIKSKRGGWMGAQEVETVVTVVDLNHWMNTHVRDRRLPNATSLRQRPRSDKLPAGPMVVMKLDVEGSEYEVLPALYASGVLCATVDLVFLELHERFIFPPKKRAALTQQMNALLQTLRRERASGRCRTSVSMLDDETYFRDDGVSYARGGVPWFTLVRDRIREEALNASRNASAVPPPGEALEALSTPGSRASRQSPWSWMRWW